jgi:hypothetical protein
MRNLLKYFLLAGASLLCLAPKASFGFISITIAPPILPVYVQPPCPVEGYMWQPGYWAWDGEEYYWVPGVWVAPPVANVVWTPGYWGYVGGIYGWHAGYWGAHCGYYGGVNYGFGYGGIGFGGGEWHGGIWRYNTAVTNVNNTVIRNTYVNNTVINNYNNSSHVSFNGPGGITARPTATEMTYANQHRIQATSAQVSHQQQARQNPQNRFSTNHGHPVNAAISRVAGHNEPAPAAHEGHPAAGAAGAVAAAAVAHHAANAAHHADAHPNIEHPSNAARPGATHPRNVGHEAQETHRSAAAEHHVPTATQHHESATAVHHPSSPHVTHQPAAIRSHAVQHPAARPHVSAPRPAPHREAPHPAPHKEEKR